MHIVKHYCQKFQFNQFISHLITVLSGPCVAKHFKVFPVHLLEPVNVLLAEHRKVFGSQLVVFYLKQFSWRNNTRQREYAFNPKCPWNKYHIPSYIKQSSTHPLLFPLVPHGRDKSLPSDQLPSQERFLCGEILKTKNHSRTKGARRALRPCRHPMVVPPSREVEFKKQPMTT